MLDSYVASEHLRSHTHLTLPLKGAYRAAIPALFACDLPRALAVLLTRSPPLACVCVWCPVLACVCPSWTSLSVKGGSGPRPDPGVVAGLPLLLYHQPVASRSAPRFCQPLRPMAPACPDVVPAGASLSADGRCAIAGRSPGSRRRLREKSARDFEFGKFNFASGFHHATSRSPTKSTLISNPTFTSGMSDLFSGVLFACQVRFFWKFSISQNAFQHNSSLPQLNSI